MSSVSSSMNATAVSGERIVPPIMAAMPIVVHKLASPIPIQPASTLPKALPIMRSGARTPPLVPDPSAMAQMIAFVAISPSTIVPLR